ncbi:putative C-mannosyltransferase DPY19L1 isoform X2 [Apostichopus japonicus]|uniref:Putative C-mannosyltransferase DPY19L1 isoform X2 n=1 Tax=Stichopus japonicus TaxID=307972 RepID=A0A2G8K0S3_STIJA|nr:putative C-mannosyltransferase DPY19L1 isoform X2 [Apostichopus japonicus]
MGYPFFILQLLAITYTLSIPRPRWLHSAFIFISSLFFMLCWQFAQFTLLTQMLSIFATFMLGYIRLSTLRCVLQGQSVALVTAYILLFGNELLLTSYYPACLITLWVIVCLEPVFQVHSSRIALWILQSVILVAGTASFKFLISSLLHVADDAHIGNLLMSKISDYKDFHTLLYICSKEFDFIETETIFRFLYSLLLPSALAALLMVMYNLLKGEYNRWSRQGDAGIKNKIDLQTNPKEGAEFVYHIFQTCAFVIMAGLIMRLKLFLHSSTLFTELLCWHLVRPDGDGHYPSRRDNLSFQVFHFIKEPVTHRALVVALIAVMTVKGVDNIREQRGHVGDFENGRLEDALEWIKSNTPKDAVFAGAMPTTSAVKLSTGRPIVNHPHYEDTEMRERTLKVYSIYSRKPTREVYSTLRDMRVQYVILEYSWCVRRYRPGCSLPEIWDVEDAENRGKEPTCMRLKRNAGPFFKEVFKNSEYTILKLNKVSQKINSQRIEVSATE